MRLTGACVPVSLAAMTYVYSMKRKAMQCELCDISPCVVLQQAIYVFTCNRKESAAARVTSSLQ
jgi:hypothetical protein